MEERNLKAQDELISFNWEGKTILVVEDEEINFFYIKESLEDTNATLLYAENGFSAIELCQSSQVIDLVLMDIKMPLMNGYEATAKIKAIRKELPVIAQTAYALSGERKKSLAAGCDDYLTKPIKPKVLIDTISKFID